MVRWIVGIVLASVVVVTAGVVALVLLTGEASEVDVDVDATVEAQVAAALDDQAAIQATVEAGIQATIEAGASPASSPPTPLPTIERSIDQAPEPPPKTPQAYRNLTSMLDGLAQDAEDGSADAEEVAARAPVSYEGTVAVTVYARDSVDEVERFLNDADVSIGSSGETYLEAFVPVNLLGPLSELDGVIRVEPIVGPQAQQTVGGPGAEAHGASDWHDMGYDGSGVKVGIIDFGFKSWDEARLPQPAGVRCYQNFVFGTSDDLDDCDIDIPWVSDLFNEPDTHGTQVAETVAAVAPGAELYIAEVATKGNLRDAVDWMISEGVTVINHSMGWIWAGYGLVRATARPGANIVL